MRRPAVAVWMVAVVTGCLGGAAADPATAQAAQQSAFVLLVGSDTLAVENVARTPTRLEGDLVGRATGRALYSLRLGPAATVEEMTLRAWMPGRVGDDAPAQDVQLTLAGDTVQLDVTGAAGTRTERLATRSGALPYVNPSFALVEQVLARSRALGDDGNVVPLFFLAGGQTLDATVTWVTRDSATIVIGGTEMHAVVRGDGSLLRAAVPAQGLTVTRTDGVHIPPPAVAPPDYSGPDGAPYGAESVIVPTPAGHTLAGTLTRPHGAERVPAAVMITGSGAQDRDQALPMLPGYRPFRDIADTLSRRGIAVLRLDDRGYGESTGTFAEATTADLADDVRAALAYLRTRPDIDAGRLALVGHSEGGIIAPKVAVTDTALAAIVLIAGTSRPGRVIIEHQQRYAIERSAAIPVEARDSAYLAAREQLEGQAGRSPWLSFFLDYDPRPAAKRVRRTPVLVLHGETDRQVPVEQAEELGAAFRAGGNPDVTVQVFPGINHLLLPDPDGNPAGYTRLEARAVAAPVLGVLADWLSERLN
jgi:uncharacterized protein